MEYESGALQYQNLPKQEKEDDSQIEIIIRDMKDSYRLNGSMDNL